MKNFKRAFTLAELLLCIGIIGIVSAMGMVITKHSTDKAYQLYYYTGYINLYNAIADGKANGLTTVSDIMNHAQELLEAQANTASSDINIAYGNQSFIPFLSYKAGIVEAPDSSFTYNNNLQEKLDHWESSFDGVTIPPRLTLPLPIGDSTVGGGSDSGSDSGSNSGADSGTGENSGSESGSGAGGSSSEIPTVSKIYGASNGIAYSYNIPSNNANTEVTKVLINMAVPAPKTRTNLGFNTVMLCFTNDSVGYLIPVVPAADSNIPDLQTRRDLLPAYIDDGNVGRNNVVNRTNFNYIKPIYGSYKDAFCSLKGEGFEVKNDEITVISCARDTYTDIRRTQGGNRINGSIKIASPQKAH